jgi:hypothetical protein
MPITVRNDVAPDKVGLLALLTGQGQYARERDRMLQADALRREQIASRNNGAAAALVGQMMGEADRRKAKDEALELSDQHYQRQRNAKMEDMDWQRENQLADQAMQQRRIDEQRAYSEGQNEAKLLRDNAAYAGDYQPPAAPGAALPEFPMPDLDMGIDNDPLKSPDDEDAFEFPAYIKKELDINQNQAAAIGLNKDGRLSPGARAKALAMLADRRTEMMKYGKLKKKSDEPLEVFNDDDGSKWYRGSDGGWKQARPEQQPRAEKPAYTAAQHASLAKQFYDEAANTRGPDGMKHPISIQEAKRLASEFLDSSPQTSNRVDPQQWSAVPENVRAQLQARISELKVEQADAKRRGDKAALDRTIAEAQSIAKQLSGGAR